MKLIITTLLLFCSFGTEALHPKMQSLFYGVKQLFSRQSNQKSIARIGMISIVGEMTSVAEYCERLFRLYRDPQIDAILIHISSNGGNGGDTLHAMIKKIRLKKPVVVVIETMCFSAAYWAASAAHYIVCPASEEIGSIGVYTEVRRDDNKKIKGSGYEADTQIEVIKAGEYKNLYNPHLDILTEQQRTSLKELVDNIYYLFCKDVAESRNINLEERNIWAEGKMFTGQQALELKLIDETGSFFEALEAVQRLLKIMSPKVFTDIDIIRF